MATYKQVSYGSQGSDVTELQKLLNKNGYSLDEDGIFGSKTQAAVKDYQQKNKLAVDGIVGKNTWGALTKASTSSAASSSGTTTKNTGFQYADYKQSDTVKQAEQMLQQQLANKPSAYQSQWQTQLNDVIQKILNREDFSYDLNGDALYQQYKDQYVSQGQMAMMDTMGQAAALTGGYGNSYAQNVGQQAYQGYLQNLNDKIPELYQLALSKYQMEGDVLTDQFSLLAQQEDQDYGRYRDQVSDYNADLDRLYDQYNTERDYDYSKYADERDFAYGQYSDDRAYAYQAERDKVADEQWQAEFDEAKRQYDQQYALATQGSSSTGSTGSDRGSDKGSKTQTPVKSGDGDTNPYDDVTWTQNGSLTKGKVMTLQRMLGVTADGLYGPETQKAAGGLSADEAYNKYVLKKGSGGSGFTGSTYSEAAAYLKAQGVSASGLMTNSEWQRHKNGNNSADGEHEASSYKEYLAAYIYGKMKK